MIQKVNKNVKVRLAVFKMFIFFTFVLEISISTKWYRKKHTKQIFFTFHNMDLNIGHSNLFCGKMVFLSLLLQMLPSALLFVSCFFKQWKELKFERNFVLYTSQHETRETFTKTVCTVSVWRARLYREELAMNLMQTDSRTVCLFRFGLISNCSTKIVQPFSGRFFGEIQEWFLALLSLQIRALDRFAQLVVQK